jgi:ribosomal protein L11 methyltransferase
MKQLVISTPDSLNKPVDLIIANILLAPLIMLKERFGDLLHTEGKLVVSGLLEEQAPTLIKTYEAQFNVIGQKQQNGWSLLIFSRK